MDKLINILVGLIAIQHIGFLYLEMFLWKTPTGQKVFKTTPEFANESAALAANQGLYNGFLATGLIWSLMHVDPLFAFQLKLFFLTCVFVAGVYGWQTVSKTILYVQATPAAVVLFLTIYIN